MRSSANDTNASFPFEAAGQRAIMDWGFLSKPEAVASPPIDAIFEQTIENFQVDASESLTANYQLLAKSSC
eukprot:scaffold659481_cov106-Prasinocladus_malaysianus.AAC.1